MAILNTKSIPWEKILFFAIVLLHLFPVFSGRFFLTLDGPAHLYNSNLIPHVLFGSNLDEYYTMNTELVPNWIGHIILSALNLIAPAHIAEKILLCCYVIGLPYAFRSLVAQIAPGRRVVSYFIFPFIYSLVLLLGFYNFCLAMVLMLVTISYWIRNDERLTQSIRPNLALFALLLLTYFSHLFIFGITLLTIGTYILVKSLLNNRSDNRTFLQVFLKKSLILLSVSAIPLILAVIYFLNRTASINEEYLSLTELNNGLLNLRSIIGLSEPREQEYTIPIVYTLSFFLLIRLFLRVRAIIRPSDSSGMLRYFQLSDVWLILALIMLFVYYTFPNANYYGGLISYRFGLLLFIFVILWITTEKYPVWLTVIGAAVILNFSFKLNSYYNESNRYASDIATSCNNAAAYIEENSIVLPLTYDGQWWMIHYSNYLGIDKPMVILENYECTIDYFPLKWNWETIPDITLGPYYERDLPCAHLKTSYHGKRAAVDYVFVLGQYNHPLDDCMERAKSVVDTEYHLVYSNTHCSVYKRNPDSQQ